MLIIHNKTIEKEDLNIKVEGRVCCPLYQLAVSVITPMYLRPSRKRKKRIQVGMKFTVPLGGYLESYQVLIIMTMRVMVIKVASLLRTEDIATQVCH